MEDADDANTARKNSFLKFQNSTARQILNVKLQSRKEIRGQKEKDQKMNMKFSLNSFG